MNTHIFQAMAEPPTVPLLDLSTAEAQLDGPDGEGMTLAFAGGWARCDRAVTPHGPL